MTNTAAAPIETLVAEGLLRHIGWQVPLHAFEWAWLGVHPHFFDSWDQDLIDFHTRCQPVFVRAQGGDERGADDDG